MLPVLKRWPLGKNGARFPDRYLCHVCLDSPSLTKKSWFTGYAPCKTERKKKNWTEKKGWIEPCPFQVINVFRFFLFALFFPPRSIIMEFGGFSLTFPLHLISVFKEVALANYLPLLSFALSIMSQEIKVLAHFPSHCSRKQWFFWSRSYWCFVGTGQAPEEGVRLCGIPCLPGLSDFDLHPLWSSSLPQNCSSTVESGSKLLRAAPDSHTYLSLERSAILLQRLYPICTIKIFQSKGFPTHSHPHWLLCLPLCDSGGKLPSESKFHTFLFLAEWLIVGFLSLLSSSSESCWNQDLNIVLCHKAQGKVIKMTFQ